MRATSDLTGCESFLSTGCRPMKAAPSFKDPLFLEGVRYATVGPDFNSAGYRSLSGRILRLLDVLHRPPDNPGTKFVQVEPYLSITAEFSAIRSRVVEIAKLSGDEAAYKELNQMMYSEHLPTVLNKTLATFCSDIWEVPCAAKQGDVVAFFEGGALPLILRSQPTDPGYTFVSPALCIEQRLSSVPTPVPHATYCCLQHIVAWKKDMRLSETFEII